jgi:hypothetical protein
METSRPLPRAAKTVASTWLGLGIILVAETVARMVARRIDPLQMLFGLALGTACALQAFGLWRRAPAAWGRAVFAALYPPLLVPPVALLWALDDHPWRSDVAVWPAVAAGVVVVAFLLWQARVLTRPDIAGLYGANLRAFWGTPKQLFFGLGAYAVALGLLATLMFGVSFR